MSDRESLLQQLTQALTESPNLVVTRDGKSDLELKAVISEASWGIGKKRVEYQSCLLAKEDERTVVYWEMVKEVGSGLGALFGFKVETYRSDGKTISGRLREVGYGPGGKAIDYRWDYAQTRKTIEEIVKANGWQFKTTLRRGQACR
jgi:hypothetical protein